MKLLLTCICIGISASSIAMNLFCDIELKEMSRDQITALDWIDLIEQMRTYHMSQQPISDHLITKFKRELKRENNFIDFPQKAANFDFSVIGIDLKDHERDQLKNIIRTFVMHAAYDEAQKELTKINQWKNTQPDSYKQLWSQLVNNTTAPSAE